MAPRFLGNGEKATQKRGRDLYLGLLPVLVLVVLLVCFRMFLRSSLIYEPTLLLPVLNTIFLFLVSCVVSYVAMRSYLLSGSPTILLLGCGVLTLGTGALAAGWLIGPEGPNVNVTIFNVSALLSSAFHSLGAVVDFRQRPPEADPERRRLKVLAGYLGVPVFVALLALAASEGIIPLFFVQGVGPTALRQAVLAIALLLFGCAALYRMSRFITEKREFFYWYSLALILLAMTLIGALLQPAVGSLLGWVSRCCQYLAGVYFLLSVRSALHGASALGLSVDGAIAEVFRQSERKISSILASIPDGHYELDREWRLIRMNDRALAYFGRDRELIGQSFWDIFPATRGSVFEEQYRKAVSVSTSTHFEEKSVVFPDKWVEFHAYPTEGRGLSVFFRDITEEKRAEVALQESEQRWATTLASIGDAVIATDTDGKITFMNTIAEGLTGWTLTDASMNPVTEVFNIINEQTRKLVENPVAKVLREGMVAGLANHTILVRKDGTEVPIDDSGAPIRDKDGNTTGVVLIFRDITERKRVEEERSLLLAEVENRAAELDATISSMATGLIVYDPAGKAVRMNDTAKRLLPSEVFLNTAIEERGRVIPWETEDGQPCPPERIPVARAVRGETVHNVVLSTSFPNGKLWISASAAPIRTSDGRMLGVVASFVDITERKRAEEEIRKSLDAVRRDEERLRVLIHNLRSGVALIDEAGKFSVVNGAFLRMFGLDSESDILNVNNQDWSRWEVCGEDGKLLHVDDHPVRKAAMTGKPVINQLVAVRHPGANEPTWMLINAEPLLREDGTVYTVISTYYDITERKQIEEELHRSRDELELRVQERTESLRRQAEALSTSEKEFRSLAEAMPQIVWITRADGWNIYFNQQWVGYTGLTLEESYGHGWNKPFHPDDRQRAWDAWRNAVTNNGTYSLECRLRAADGAYRWWLVRGVPITNEKGETTKWFGTCTDIEEIKRVEAQLRQAQKMEALGTLTGGVAHDFNNILAAIIGFTELVADHVPKESREAHHLKRVMESSLRGRDLVRQMLIYSRKAEQERKPLSLSTIVEETVKFIRATTPTTISIKVDTLKDSGPILADPAQMQQVVMNLCTNAAHAMREKGGTLDIQVSNHRVSLSNGNSDGIKPGLYTRLTVRDTGTGISPDIMDKIFDPFFTTKKLGEGTGLGLSVIHGIVKQSNGHITVESKPERGSTFTVYFPQITGELKADAISDDEIPTGSQRILFVDDEEALVEMGEDVLAELGYEVTSRMSSKEALALFKTNPLRFDLVITDQTMPEMTGVELVKEILALRADMPIIMCTGFSHMVNEKSAKAAGIRAFAMKPLTKREIARTIRKVLDE